MNPNIQIPGRQGGVALVVVLVLLVVLTLLALTSIRGTLMEQYMSTSQMDRSISFQLAEAALREAEAIAATKPTKPSSGCTAGVCAAPAAGSTPRWLDTDANWNAMSEPLSTDAMTAINTSLGGMAITPRYIIEVMADGNYAIPGASCTTSGDISPDAACTGKENRYRITARSAAGSSRAEVILQSNLAVP